MAISQKWENGHVMDVVSFKEDECSFYRGAHFNGHMYILLYSMVNQWCFVSCIQYILPLNLLIFIFLFINVFLHTAYRGEGELYACKNRASMSKHRRGMTFSPMFGKACQHVILSPLNGHVTEVVCSMEGEWSYRGGQFNGERMVMLRRWTV